MCRVFGHVACHTVHQLFTATSQSDVRRLYVTSDHVTVVLTAWFNEKDFHLPMYMTWQLTAFVIHHLLWLLYLLDLMLHFIFQIDS